MWRHVTHGLLVACAVAGLVAVVYLGSQASASAVTDTTASERAFQLAVERSAVGLTGG